jgi:hypothetical protein
MGNHIGQAIPYYFRAPSAGSSVSLGQKFGKPISFKQDAATFTRLSRARLTTHPTLWI